MAHLGTAHHAGGRVGEQQADRAGSYSEAIQFEHEHFLRVLTTAFAEYVIEISRTGTDYRHISQFLQAAERNLSFAYIVFFLYLLVLLYF